MLKSEKCAILRSSQQRDAAKKAHFLQAAYYEPNLLKNYFWMFVNMHVRTADRDRQYIIAFMRSIWTRWHSSLAACRLRRRHFNKRYGNVITPLILHLTPDTKLITTLYVCKHEMLLRLKSSIYLVKKNRKLGRSIDYQQLWRYINPMFGYGNLQKMYVSVQG